MAEINKVTDPLKMVTDSALLAALARQGVDKNYIELVQDYAPCIVNGKMAASQSPYAKFYRDLKSDKRFAVISQLPMVDADGFKVEAGWAFGGEVYTSKNNLFNAAVRGGLVTITLKGRSGALSYNPRLYLDGVEQFCGKPKLLQVDPVNENYTENTLVWNYGICERRLRIIEGHLLGTWVFKNKPSGVVAIKYNQSGDFKLRLGQFKITDDEEVISVKSFDWLSELRGYPVTIDDSLTFYSSALDGAVGLTGQTSWANAHDTANGSVVYSSADQIYVSSVKVAAANWYIHRGYLYFDTSSLSDSITISGAVLSLYGNADAVEQNADQADLGLVEGTFDAGNVGLAVADFGAILAATTLGHDAYFDFHSWNAAGYNDFTLNATGISWISKTGITKFGIRNRADITNTAPAGYNYIYPYASEKGTGYKPKLVVTYTPVTPTVTTQAVSSVTNTTCTGNGNITDTGGADCSRRGFCYKAGTSGDPVTTDSVAYDDGTFGMGAFTKSINGLTPGLGYRVRAYAVNSAGTGYGTTVQVNMAGITAFCEIAWTNNPFDATPTYVDVSSDLLNYNIKRGRQYEIDLFEAGEATITLLNHAGDYWPDNGASIYDPNVTIGKRVRIKVAYNGTTYVRYVGYIEAYTPQWGLQGLLDPRMELKCGDALSLIARVVMNAPTDASLLTGTATGGTKIVPVTNGALYAAGQVGVLSDTTPQSETCVIASIAGNTLTMRDNLVNTYTVAATGVFTGAFPTELSGVRVRRVFDAAGFPTADRIIDTGQYPLIASGAMANVNAFDHTKNACTAEIGVCYIDQTGKAVFEDRSHRTLSPHTVSQATFATNYPDIEISLDDHLLFNQIRGTRTGGVEQIANDGTSQALYQLHALVRSSLLLTTDYYVMTYVNYLLARYSTPHTRAASISILPGAAPATLFPYCFGFDISTRITVTAPTPSGINTDFFIENIEENYDAAQPELWNFRWLLSNADGYTPTPSALKDTLRPTAAGDKTENGPYGAGTNYGCVLEVVQDGDTTYVEPGSSGTLTDLYNIANATYPVGTINSVKIYGWFKETGALSNTITALTIKTEATEYAGAGFEPAATYGEHSVTYTTNPNTGIAWTWAEINALQIGGILWRSASGSFYRSRLTQVYAVVNFTPSW